MRGTVTSNQGLWIQLEIALARDYDPWDCNYRIAPRDGFGKSRSDAWRIETSAPSVFLRLGNRLGRFSLLFGLLRRTECLRRVCNSTITSSWSWVTPRLIQSTTSYSIAASKAYSEVVDPSLAGNYGTHGARSYRGCLRDGPVSGMNDGSCP